MLSSWHIHFYDVLQVIHGTFIQRYIQEVYFFSELYNTAHIIKLI